MESYIIIRATAPEMNAFFEEESGVRHIKIQDRRYSSDEIERMPEDQFNSKVFTWAVTLRHPETEKELHGTFTISGVKKRLEEMRTEQKRFFEEDNLC